CEEHDKSSLLYCHRTIDRSSICRYFEHGVINYAASYNRLTADAGNHLTGAFHMKYVLTVEVLEARIAPIGLSPGGQLKPGWG
ncbi:MAG: hypothetical protein V3T31_07305, partial [candidate division Zixibacteria bacterium]